MSKKEINKLEEPVELYEKSSKNESTSEDLHPVLIQLLEKSIQQANKGMLISHEEVMRQSKEKYSLLK
jgi:hypothetical protein